MYYDNFIEFFVRTTFSEHNEKHAKNQATEFRAFPHFFLGLHPWLLGILTHLTHYPSPLT